MSDQLFIPQQETSTTPMLRAGRPFINCPGRNKAPTSTDTILVIESINVNKRYSKYKYIHINAH